MILRDCPKRENGCYQFCHRGGCDGQVCADSIGPKFFSGVGGQMDFIYGASRSKGGVPIIALPSTATLKDGTTISRIVSMLKQGAVW